MHSYAPLATHDQDECNLFERGLNGRDLNNLENYTQNNNFAKRTMIKKTIYKKCILVVVVLAGLMAILGLGFLIRALIMMFYTLPVLRDIYIKVSKINITTTDFIAHSSQG